jgi:hypothetical protein
MVKRRGLTAPFVLLMAQSLFFSLRWSILRLRPLER